MKPPLRARFGAYLFACHVLDADVVTSQQIAELVGVHSEQIRRDLSEHIGLLGRRGYGYKRLDLRQSLRDVLGGNATGAAAIVASSPTVRFPVVTFEERLAQEATKALRALDERLGR